MLDIIEIYRESLSSDEVKRICNAMKQDGVQALALREVSIKDKDYKALLKHVVSADNIRHLSLSIGLVTDGFRIQILALCIQRNKSLSGLFLHGNALKDAGIKALHPSLLSHPCIVALDVSDCEIGDEGLSMLCSLLPVSPARPGLRELILSGNPAIKDRGWSRLGLALMQGTNLCTLYVDYNQLTDVSASCLLMGIVGSPELQTLDMECTGITDKTGQLLLHLLEQYPTIHLKTVNLTENDISQATINAIMIRMPDVDDNDSFTDINSDDVRSLATSEPPLDSDVCWDEFSENGSQIYKVHPINIAVAKTRQADTVGDTASISDVADNSFDAPSEIEEIDKVADDAVSLDNQIKTNRRTSSSLVYINGEMKDMGDSLRSSSTSAIQNTTFKALLKSSSSSEYHAYDPDTVTVPTGNTTYHNITGTNSGKEQNDCQNTDDMSIGNFLIPETPSVVSLHTYQDGFRGQDDDNFEPVKTLVIPRPCSAPINNKREQSKYSGATGDNSHSQVDSSHQLSLERNKPKSPHKKKQELSVVNTHRRLSVGSVLSISGTNRRPSVGSTHKLTRDHSLQIDDHRPKHLSPVDNEPDSPERENIRRRLSSASIHTGGFSKITRPDSAGSSSTLGDLQVEEIA